MNGTIQIPPKWRIPLLFYVCVLISMCAHSSYNYNHYLPITASEVSELFVWIAGGPLSLFFVQRKMDMGSWLFLSLILITAGYGIKLGISAELGSVTRILAYIFIFVWLSVPWLLSLSVS